MKSVVLILLVTVLGIGCNSSAAGNLSYIDQLINSEQLSGYWHIDSFPERAPLIVHVIPELDTSGVKLEKFGQPVKFTHELPDSTPALVIESIAKNEAGMTIKFSYPPEGLRGIAKYSKVEERWRLIDLTLHES